MSEETKAPEKTKARKTLKDVVSGFADQSVENKAKGKDPVKLSLTDKFNLEFTQDYKAFKKGDSVEVSELAKEFYVQNGYAKVVK